MVEQAKDNFGGLHAVVNNAGILRDRIFHKMSEEEFDAVVAVHLKGCFNVSRAAAETFRNQSGGAFVHMTSTSGLVGNFGQVNYGAAKLGIAAYRNVSLSICRAIACARIAFRRLRGVVSSAPFDKHAGREGAGREDSADDAGEDCTFGCIPLQRPIAGRHRSDLWRTVQ